MDEARKHDQEYRAKLEKARKELAEYFNSYNPKGEKVVDLLDKYLEAKYG